MDADAFVEALVSEVHEPSVKLEELTMPTGRRPPKRLVELHEWVSSLPESDRARLRQVAELAVHSALFGLFCVLDGVRRIDSSSETVEFQLKAIDGDSEQLLNAPSSEPLHDIYQALTWERVYGES